MLNYIFKIPKKKQLSLTYYDMFLEKQFLYYKLFENSASKCQFSF